MARLLEDARAQDPLFPSSVPLEDEAAGLPALSSLWVRGVVAERTLVALITVKEGASPMLSQGTAAPTGEVTGLLTHPHWRRHGLAESLLARAEREFGASLWTACSGGSPLHGLLKKRVWEELPGVATAPAVGFSLWRARPTSSGQARGVSHG